MSNRKQRIVDLLIDGETQMATDELLMEAEEDDLLANLGGETTLMNYLLKFEEYLDDHDLYLFHGWEKGEIVEKPKVEKFWVTFYVRVPGDCELKGARRLSNDKEGQNVIKVKDLDDGTHLVMFKILKRYLDEIEQRNKERSDQLSDEDMESI